MKKRWLPREGLNQRLQNKQLKTLEKQSTIQVETSNGFQKLSSELQVPINQLENPSPDTQQPFKWLQKSLELRERKVNVQHYIMGDLYDLDLNKKKSSHCKVAKAHNDNKKRRKYFSALPEISFLKNSINKQVTTNRIVKPDVFQQNKKLYDRFSAFPEISFSYNNQSITEEVNTNQVAERNAFFNVITQESLFSSQRSFSRKSSSEFYTLKTSAELAANRQDSPLNSSMRERSDEVVSADCYCSDNMLNCCN